MLILPVIIMWFCLAVLCLNCVNNDYNLKKDWLEMPVWKRLMFLTVLPFLYLLLAGYSSFEK